MLFYSRVQCCVLLPPVTLAENNNNAFVPLRLASVKAGDGSHPCRCRQLFPSLRILIRLFFSLILFALYLLSLSFFFFFLQFVLRMQRLTANHEHVVDKTFRRSIQSRYDREIFDAFPRYLDGYRRGDATHSLSNDP